MPKNDRTARLLRVQYLLYQHPWGLTPEQLARLCSVSTRTAYRDLRALDRDGGVPLWQEEGRYGIVQGYFLPPVRFSLLEATVLFLSSRLAQRHSDERNRALETAWTKLGAVLPSPVGRHVAATVTAMSSKPVDEEFSRVSEILIAAWSEQRRVRIWYPVSGGKEAQERLIEPYFLQPSGISHSLYVIAHDAGAGAMRTFKVERIREIELTREGFEVPEEFDADAYLRSSWSVWNEEPVDVLLRFSPSVAAVVGEASWHPSQTTEPQGDGSLIWRARVSGTVEIAPWIRSWGPDVEVLAPTELRERIAEESRRQAAIYGQGTSWRHRT